MNMLQAHVTTTHVLTKNTPGQYQPQGSNHITAANATERTKNARKTLTDGQLYLHHSKNQKSPVVLIESYQIAILIILLYGSMLNHLFESMMNLQP